MEGTVTVVCGRKRDVLSVSRLWELAAAYRRVIVDLGTGDGRWLYRLARRHPDWFCLGIDSDPAGMRAVSFRAGRKASRGGVRNVVYVYAAAETLPASLEEFADEIHINFPWGRLLRAVVRPEATVLGRISRLGKEGAGVHVRVNISAVWDRGTLDAPNLPQRAPVEICREIVRAYKSVGFASVQARIETSLLLSSWGKRLGQGRPLPILTVDAVVRSLR